ncbi:hypothetical protein LWI28_007623 [Acer negundo]|uniref:RNase H type-1 domain-containing protein n=1 Tax=Acer negundo TaxID=4023 RepID=A0AAD5NU09_ACENE|nr:hypothetical protein LWI28_007623 [Acer negundo]
MVAYLAKVREAMSGFKVMRMEQIPREKNHQADVLAKIPAADYLQSDTLPTDLDQARKLKRIITRTTRKIATRETPYSLVFGTEAIFPIEHRLISFRIQNYELEDNGAKLRANLDLLEEKQSRIIERVAVY